MPRITVTISESLDEYLEEESGDDGEFDSKSEVMRHLAERGREADDLERELEIAENRIDELREQMKHREQVEEKVDVLAKRLEDQEQSGTPPFPVRWWRWWQNRGDSGDSQAESTS
jgi:Arc/MetJ-type ribon-helix-helix transcriptional regulator